MNADDLTRLLRATPGEPELPADPVGIVHRRARIRQLRRRGTAGALAVALAVVVGGVALGAPDHHDGGDSRIQVAHPTATPSVAPTQSPSVPTRVSPSARPTASGRKVAPPTLVKVTASARATTTAAGRTVTPPVPLHFTWSVRVSGHQVAVSGSWSGESRTLAAATLAADQAPSTFAQAGSGVLGLAGYFSNADGSNFTATELSQGAPQGNVYESNGDIPTCTGPVTFQRRSVVPETITVTRPGAYLLVMHSYTCSGERDDAVRVTVG